MYEGFIFSFFSLFSALILGAHDLQIQSLKTKKVCIFSYLKTDITVFAAGVKSDII